jgi:hypothetical protein
MLRSLGIPARLAVGFAQGEATQGIQRPGETEIPEQEFTVFRKHTHAWPEVYFPGIGWVEFEPTGNQAPLIRPATPLSDLPVVPASDAEATPEEISPEISPEETASDTALASPWLKMLLWTVAMFLVAVALYFADRKFTLATRVAEYVLSATEKRGERNLAWVRNAALFVLADPFERAFHPVNLSLRWLGESPAPHWTPAERAQSLRKILPEAEDEIEDLLREYQSAQYTPRGGDIHRARRASLRLLWLGLKAAIRRANNNVRW